MPLDLLIDVSVGRTAEDRLKQAGHNVSTVRDRDPHMADADILAWAVSEGRLVVTMEKDFGELVFRSSQAHTGVLLVRLEHATGAEKAELLVQLLQQYEDQLPGCFSVFQHGTLRIRTP